jgi:hypothetical protein
MRLRITLGILLAATLLAGTVLGFARTARSASAADSTTLTFGRVIKAINHTDAAVEALGQTTSIPLDQVTLVDITPIVTPPSPITPPNPIRAFHRAIARNAEDILTLRAALPSLQLTSSPTDCGGQCILPATVGDLLASQNVSVESIATATFSGSRLTIYFSPSDPCVQDPLHACRDGNAEE